MEIGCNYYYIECLKVKYFLNDDADALKYVLALSQLFAVSSDPEWLN